MEIGDAIKRLAFIKYLFTVGVEQTEKPEPLCWASVLTFHDAAELFLQLAAEYVGVKGRLKDIHFLEYWSLINNCLKKIGKNELTQLISMERLNKARVNFKHYGTPPSQSAITGDFKVSVTNFFEENTALVFGIKFDEISMLEVISYQRTKDDLKKAEELLNQNKLLESLDNVALAFQKLVDDYESKKRNKWGESPFSVGPRSYRQFSGFSMGIKGDLGRFIDWTTESLDSIQEIVRIIGFGIDYKKYAKFKLLTPHVLALIGGTYSIQRKDKSPSLNDIRFCIDFVVESALALQEFDFEVGEAEEI
jgi:hypothetical protein